MGDQQFFVIDPAAGDMQAHVTLAGAIHGAQQSLTEYRTEATHDGEWMLDVEDIAIYRAPLGSEWDDVVEAGEKVAITKGIHHPDPDDQDSDGWWDYAIDLTDLGAALKDQAQ